MTLLSQYWGEQRVYHHTAPINMTYALYEGLRMVSGRGLENRFARHRLNHAALSAGLAALGIEQVVAEANRLPMMAAVKNSRRHGRRRDPPQALGAIQHRNLRRPRALKGKAWRIGVMGHGSRRENVLLLLSALEQLLAEHGRRIAPDSAVAARKTDI